MGIYRPVHVRIWGDKKFRQLPNDAKLLFLYLFTGPHTTSLPGLSEAGEMRLAEVLGWDVRQFRDCLKILEDNEMAYFDDEARVLFLPNVIKHNSPRNSFIVKGWFKTWDMIPECELKFRFINHIRPFMEQLGGRFLQAFNDQFQDIPETMSTLVYETNPSPGTVLGTETETGDKTKTAKKISKKSEPKIKAKSEPLNPEQFELFRKYYPNTHHNERLNIIQQWNISIRERGATPEQLIEAAQIYAGICKREGRIKKHIKGAQVFLGHKMPWKDILDSGIRPDISETAESNIEDLSKWASDKEAEETNEESTKNNEA